MCKDGGRHHSSPLNSFPYPPPPPFFLPFSSTGTRVSHPIITGSISQQHLFLFQPLDCSLCALFCYLFNLPSCSISLCLSVPLHAPGGKAASRLLSHNLDNARGNPCGFVLRVDQAELNDKSSGVQDKTNFNSTHHRVYSRKPLNNAAVACVTKVPKLRLNRLRN